MNLKIKEELKKQKILQIELANHLNTSQSLVSMYVNNETNPPLETLCKIADFLHVSLDELVGRQTNNINLDVYEPETKTLIQKILNMSKIQKAQTINFVNSLTMFDE